MSTPGRWLVTGGGGLLGQHVVRAARAAGVEVVAPTSTDLDIRTDTEVAALVDAVRPAAILHLAYRKGDPDVIVDGTANIAASAARIGARLVHMSTDALFAGRDAPYVEADAPTPVTDYGRWKAEAEQIVAATCPGAAIVRTSLMYRTDQPAPCQLDVIEAIGGRNDIRFFTDEVRCFSPVDDVAAGVVTVTGDPTVSGPLHIACQEALDRSSFARAVARWSGLDPEAVPTSSIAESGMARPARVVLDSSYARSRGIECRSVADALV